MTLCYVIYKHLLNVDTSRLSLQSQRTYLQAMTCIRVPGPANNNYYYAPRINIPVNIVPCANLCANKLGNKGVNIIIPSAA